MAQFLRQYLAFKRKDPTILMADIDLVGMTRQFAADLDGGRDVPGYTVHRNIGK
jgi:hypothetical protein